MPDEDARVRSAYERRAAAGADDRYSLDDPANRFLFGRRARAITALLASHHELPLAAKAIVDIGCGNGAVLDDFVSLGADTARCAGIDLLEQRAANARERLPGADIRYGSATSLPWPNDTFDLALQFTLLSSVLDSATRRNIADETIRVLKPGGALLYYDFIWNPGNTDTRGLRLPEIRGLYAGHPVEARRITLAPPITRRLARWSSKLCAALEALPFLRSHYLVLVMKQ